MTASMTAFARKQRDYDWGTMSWEIRSVNHRYLEPSLRIPDILRPIEPVVRERLRKNLSRGKLDLQLRLQIDDQHKNQLSLNTDAVRQITELATQVRNITPDASPLSTRDILQWPGILTEPELDADGLQAQALELLNQTLADFAAAREREGAELAQLIRQRLTAIRDIVHDVRQRMPDILAQQQENIRARLDAFKLELEPTRLEQEMVLLAHKSDVDEELDRLNTHVTEVERVLNTREPIGRRLDFLLQELNREANTLSSKSIVSETTRSAVELKVLIEQIREQVQNIE